MDCNLRDCLDLARSRTLHTGRLACTPLTRWGLCALKFRLRCSRSRARFGVEDGGFGRRVLLDALGRHLVVAAWQAWSLRLLHCYLLQVVRRLSADFRARADGGAAATAALSRRVSPPRQCRRLSRRPVTVASSAGGAATVLDPAPPLLAAAGLW